MPEQSNPSIEPFVERAEHWGDATARYYRFGYRLNTTKQVLSHVTIPAEMVELALTCDISLTTKITSEGDVVPVLAGPGELTMAPSALWTATSVDRLVADAITAETLHLEEAGHAELDILRQRLEHAIWLVTQAIERQAHVR